MSRLDDRLTHELERAARPASPAGAFERVDRRRGRRARLRRIQSGMLIVVVLTGTVAGFMMLSNAFRERGPGIGAAPDVGNGVIVYSEIRNAGEHLWVVNPDGTGVRQLTTEDGVSDSGPAVSPDGRTVAFTRVGATGPTVWAVGIDGSGLRQVAGFDGMSSDPTWSPDGTEIAFVGPSGAGETPSSAIFIEDADGSNVRTVSRVGGSATGLSWSPDGKEIAFAAPGDATAAVPNDDLWITDVEGVTQVNITVSTDASETSPSWSPDGSRILFSRTTPSGGASLMTTGPDPDASPVALTDGTTLDQNPAWSPDGSRVVFDRTWAGGTDIYTMQLDGSDLTLAARNATDPAWQPAPNSPSDSPVPATTTTGRVVVETSAFGFPVCNVSTVAGTFRDQETVGVAYVATKMSDVGGCPPVEEAFNVIGIDLDGDGLADVVYGPIECEMECRAFSTPDLNRDGISELLVVQRGGTELVLGVFAMQANFGPDGTGIIPVKIAAPGDPNHGFAPGEAARLFIGGDEGNAQRLSCERTTGQVLVVQSTGSLVPFDSPDAVLKIHETTFVLDTDGNGHVVNTRELEVPPGSPPFDEPIPTDVPRTFPCT